LKDNAGLFAVSDAALQLPCAMAAVKDDSDVATKKVNDLIRGTRVSDDVASQLAADRYWRRTQRTLDSIKDPAKLVAAAQDVIANADDQTVPVLTAELGDYHATRNVPTGWMPDALADKVPGLADASADAITKARQYAVPAAQPPSPDQRHGEGSRRAASARPVAGVGAALHGRLVTQRECVG
jgi:hypothetical protein